MATNPMITKLSAATPLVLLGQQTGVTVIPAQTPLTRLNYFDGKFLRAQDLQAEQNYLRQLTHLSNQANGFGVVNGFDLALSGGDQLKLSAGLAIDPRGRVLLLGQEQALSIQDLINRSREFTKQLQSSTLKAVGGFADCESVSNAPPTNAVPGRDWFLITLSHAEALCGEEDVYGKLCQEACVTSTDRPYRLEGVVVRALPLMLSTPLAQSSAISLDRTHLRSLIASAFYSDERKRVGDLISKAGLASPTWCHGALGLTGNEIAIGVLVRDGNTTLFLDEWIARRELMETSPRRYWQWRMAMRPWDVYLAQILQFQCQLHHQFETGGPDTDDDPCAEAKKLVDEAAKHFKVLNAYFKQTTSKLQKMSKVVRDRLMEEAPEFTQSSEQYAVFEARLQQASKAFQLMPRDRLLIRSGIVETPSAGYLPVVPGDTVSVNDQVRRFMGEGVDLRFCVVRPDYVPHALEEAQHMERISLLEGLDNPNNKPKVDVLVPNGKIMQDRALSGRYYEMRLNLIPENLELLALAVQFAQQANGTKASAALSNGANNTDASKILAKYVAIFARSGERKNTQTFEYSGAARGDVSASGGVVFYYAGITRPTSIPVPRPQPVPAPAPAPNPTTGTATPGGPPLSTGSSTTSSTASAAASAAAAAIASDDLIMERTLRANVNINADAVEREIETRSSFWLSVELAKDPTELARNESVIVKAECFLAFTMQVSDNSRAAAAGTTQTKTVTQLLRCVFNGELNIEDVSVRTGATELREVKGTLAGELTLSLRAASSEANREQETFSIYLSEPVQIQRSAGAHGPLFKVSAPNWSFLQPLVDDIDAQREWTSAQKAEALSTIKFNVPQLNAAGAAAGTKSVVRQAFRAWQTLNANVREPQHPAHEDAIRALRSISSALGNVKFADLSAQRLFPPQRPVQSELNVLATMDWVLFHRRREKTCQMDKPVLAIDTRQYALYHVQLTGDQKLADVRRQLERTGATAKLPTLDFVQLVEFGAGIHAVMSSHTQVQASWRQDVGNDAGDVIGGFIASQGVAAAEGERLAQERLESLVDVIETTPPANLLRSFEVLGRVPDALNAANNDGVIIVVTRAEVATNCHTVVAVENAASAAGLAAAARAGRFNQALAADKLAKTLGTVNFTTATPNAAQLQTILQAWNALDFKPVTSTTVIANATDQAATSYTAQSNALLAAFGGSGVAQAVTTIETLSGCPAVTIVAGSVERRNVLYIYGNWDRPNHFLQPTATNSPGEFRNNIEQGDALENFIASLTPNQPVLGVTLATTQAAPDAGATIRLQSVLQALTAAGRPMPAPTRRTIEALNTHDRAELARIGKNPDSFAEIIFFELNAGA